MLRERSRHGHFRNRYNHTTSKSSPTSRISEKHQVAETILVHGVFVNHNELLTFVDEHFTIHYYLQSQANQLSQD